MIRVGGATEIEVKEKKDRVDDALHATRAAVEEGIVPGGGVAAAARGEGRSTASSTSNDDQRTGVEIVRQALQQPARQIVENAGVDGSVVVGKILDNKRLRLRLRRADRRIRRPLQARHHRPDQGRAHRAAGRGLGRRPADHHRGDGRREAEEGTAAPAMPGGGMDY